MSVRKREWVNAKGEKKAAWRNGLASASADRHDMSDRNRSRTFLDII
jgi:hypothetical protein